MISLDGGRREVTKMLTGLTDALAITRSQAVKGPPKAHQEEENLKNSWREQQQARNYAQEIIEKQQNKHKGTCNTNTWKLERADE